MTSEKDKALYETRWVLYHSILVIEMLIIIILLLLMLMSMPKLSAQLNKNVMDELAAQIPIPTTPKEMHEARERYRAAVAMFAAESVKYRLNCYKAFFQKEIETGSETIMIHGVTPDEACAYFSRRIRNGHPVPEIDALVGRTNDR